ncbi:hypothetical protein FS842_009892 [Serendipita sp. 407]|nr:hypothetical protein FS842_009892 [Serendipita sp. 407]
MLGVIGLGPDVPETYINVTSPSPASSLITPKLSLCGHISSRVKATSFPEVEIRALDFVPGDLSGIGGLIACNLDNRTGELWDLFYGTSSIQSLVEQDICTSFSQDRVGTAIF